MNVDANAFEKQTAEAVALPIGNKVKIVEGEISFGSTTYYMVKASIAT